MRDQAALRTTGARQPTDVPLPTLDSFPDLPHAFIDPEHERRERALARARGAVQERAAWRTAIQRLRDELPPFIEPSEVVVAFRLDSRGTHALVEFRTGRVGSRRVLRRLGGPLRVDQRSVRGMGPSVGLLRLIRALADELDR